MLQQSPRAENRTSRAPSSKSVASRGQAAVPAAGRADSPRAIVRTVPERANAWATKEWPLGTAAGDSFATAAIDTLFVDAVGPGGADEARLLRSWCHRSPVLTENLIRAG